MTSLEEMYRGPIYEDFNFYLAARLNPGISSRIIHNNGLHIHQGDGNTDPVFLLCLNRFSEHGQEKHRLYWSNDTNDFVLNPLDNSQNQGAVIMNFKKNIKSYNLYYRTQLNLNKNSNVVNQYAVDNNFNINDISNNIPSSFTIVPTISPRNGADVANVSDVIYTSLDYNMFSGEEYIDWIFRGTSTPNIPTNADFIHSGPSISNKPNNNNFNTHFQTCNTVGVSLTGPGLSAIYHPDANNFALSVGFLTPATNGLSFPDIPDTGILHLIQGEITENIKYDHYNFNNNTFYFSGEGLSYFDTDHIHNPSPTESATVTVNIRNDPRNFKKLSEMVPDHAVGSQFRSSAMELFFIPVEKNSYFAPGEALVNVDFFTPTNITDDHIYFYNYKTGMSTLKDRSLIYFSNYLQDSFFGPLTQSYNSNLPLIPKPYKDGATSVTALIWSDVNESHNPYKYHYCRGDELCGNCMGLTSNRAFYCHAYDGSLAAYAPGGLEATTPESNPQAKPLSSKKLQLDIILEILFLGILLIVIVIVIFFVIKERNKFKMEESKIIKQA